MNLLLQLVWLAAIAHMRTAGRKRLDHCERWRDIDDIGEALGYPPAPMAPWVRRPDTFGGWRQA